MGITNNKMVEARHQLIKQHREATLHTCNKVAQATPESQHNVGDWVWLEAKYLALPYASAKLAPKCHSPFQITKEISLVAYQLTLPKAWTIHDIFHSLLLTPYKETLKHGAQFQCPPLELIGNKEEYEVEQIINHWHHEKHHQLQYLICWKGYSAADDTWEPTDQVHANELVKSYHAKHAKNETRHKNQRRTKIKATIWSLLTCPQPTQQTSLPPLPQASPLTWTLPNHSLSDPKPRPQWSIDRSCFQSPPQLWQSQKSSVSSNSPPIQYAPLLKGIGHQGERNFSSLCKDWQELCKKIKKSATTIKNNLKYSGSKERTWQSARHMQLTWKKPMSIGKPTTTRNSRSGTWRSKGWKDMRKMKDTSLIFSSQSLMVTMSSMSSPPTSNRTAYTAWAPLALASLSTGKNYSHHNVSLSTRKGSSLIGSLTPSPTIPPTLPCTTIPTPRETGGLQAAERGRCHQSSPAAIGSKPMMPAQLTCLQVVPTLPCPPQGTLHWHKVHKEVHLPPWQFMPWCGSMLIRGWCHREAC